MSPQNRFCLNCKVPLIGPHCHGCGQAATVERFKFDALLRELPRSLFQVDRSIGRTMLALFTRPGSTINAYLDGRRIAFFDPFALMLLMASVSVLLLKIFPLEIGFTDEASKRAIGEKLQLVFAASLEYYAVSLTLSLPLAAFFSWLHFRGWGRNFAEHIVINAFIAAITAALTTIAILAIAPILADPRRFDGFEMAAAILLYLAMGTYQIVALYAVFALAGRRLRALMWSLSSATLYNLFAAALTYGILFLIYGPL